MDKVDNVWSDWGTEHSRQCDVGVGSLTLLIVHRDQRPCLQTNTSVSFLKSDSGMLLLSSKIDFIYFCLLIPETINF